MMNKVHREVAFGLEDSHGGGSYRKKSINYAVSNILDLAERDMESLSGGESRG